MTGPDLAPWPSVTGRAITAPSGTRRAAGTATPPRPGTRANLASSRFARHGPNGGAGYIDAVTPDEEQTYPEPDVSADNPESEHWLWAGAHRPPLPRPFVEYMTHDWAARKLSEPPHPAADRTRDRRSSVRTAFADKTIVVPSGGLKVRANDTDFRFRPGSDFFWLTACDDVDAVVVVHPDGHHTEATLYVEDRRDSSSHRFFSDSRYGEAWVGPRRGLAEAAHRWGIGTAPRDQLEKDLVALEPSNVVALRGYDERVDAVARLCQRGYAERIVLSHDAMCVVDWFPRSMIAAAPDWRWTHIPDDVLPLMRQRGISEADIHTMMVENPRTILEGGPPY